MKYFPLLWLLLAIPVQAAKPPTLELKVAILSVDTAQIAAYAEWANKFETLNPDISLNVDYYSDKAYKAGLNTWLEDGTYDIMYWQGGLRLSNLVDRSLLKPISTIIDEQTLSKAISSSVFEQVTYNGQIYAIPFAQYTWGFYYNKDIFKQHKIEPPTTWQEFLAISQLLKNNDVYPLIQANTEGWPLLSWLDYLSFQQGGHKLRNKLLNNQRLHPSEANRLVNAFEELIDKDFFFAHDYPWVWHQAISMVGRKQAAMTLMGQFAESAISYKMSDRMGFFNLPSLNDSSLAMTPLEVFMVPASNRNLKGTKQFLEYLLNPQNQTELALSLGWLPVNLDQINSADVTIRQQTAIEYLKKMPNRIQYFDRESNNETATHFVNSLSKAFDNKSSDYVAQSLDGIAISPSKNLEESNPGKLLKLSSIKNHASTFLATSILRQVYQSLGIDLAIRRFQSTQESINSYNNGIDGELVRIKTFETITDNLIRITEPLFYDELFLLTRGRQCDEPNVNNNKGKIVGVSSDALILDKVAENLGIHLSRFSSDEALWIAYEAGDISTLITTESDIPQGYEDRNEVCKHSIVTIPLYHYIHVRHAELAEDITKAIVMFKSTTDYQALLERYEVPEQ